MDPLDSIAGAIGSNVEDKEQLKGVQDMENLKGVQDKEQQLNQVHG